MGLLRLSESDEWKDFVGHSFYPLAVHSVSAEFEATARLTELNRGLRLAEVESGASSLERTRKPIIASPSDELLFLVQLAGAALIEQAGRQLVLREGHATFCDPSVSYTITQSEGQQQIVTMIP